jgi:hypothetical protein
MKWLLLLRTFSSSDHPIVYLGYETDAHCEAAGEEIKALSTFRAWPTANMGALYSRDLPDRYRSVPGEALA